jgi:hypothetical protein
MFAFFPNWGEGVDKCILWLSFAQQKWVLLPSRGTNPIFFFFVADIEILKTHP